MIKCPFIDGFREPTLSKNSYFLISDVRGDGQGKLVIWSQQQNQLVVYKGSNRELEKPVKLKNVTAIVQYYDEESSTQPVIGLAAQNGLYIFRGLMQSFRLKVPDVIAQVQQQIIWSQHKDNPSRISSQLLNIKPHMLSQKAKYFLSASSEQRKKQVTNSLQLQIIEQVFQEGISQKDSISAVTVIKQTQTTGIGNIAIGTQLNRLYILDTYGHRIVHQRVISFAPCMMFAFGCFQAKYVLVCVNRQGIISMFLNADNNQPSQTIRLNTRVTSADLSYPDFAISTADRVISVFSFSNSNFKMSVPRFSMKLGQKPLKLLFMKKKGTKLLIIAFQNQFRIYRDKQQIYRHQTDFPLYSMLYGSFSREEGCLILLYQTNGFQVLIGHRLFNPKENYETRKSIKNKSQQENTENKIQIPKKTPLFLKYWNTEPDKLQNFKMFQRNMKLLKWQTLRGKIAQKKTTGQKIETNPKILGLGPNFIIKLQLQNISNSPIFGIKILISIENNSLQVKKAPSQICMLAPFTPTLKEIEIVSLTLKPQRFKVDLYWKDNIASTIVCVPGCAEMEG